MKLGQMTDKRPDIGQTVKTQLTDWGGAAVSLVPWAGPFLQNLAQKVENDRQNRAEIAISYLFKVLSDGGHIPKRDEPSLDELQNAGISSDTLSSMVEGAVKADNEQRLKHFARIVAAGVSGSSQSQSETRRHLDALRGISDEALILLCNHHPKFSLDTEFQNLHKAVLEKPYIGEESTPSEMYDSSAYFGRIDELRQYGLVERVVTARMTDFQVAATEITMVGNRFLMACGLADYPAVRLTAQKEFIHRVFHCYESLRDSNQANGTRINSILVTFLGFNPKLEPHYNPHCKELHSESRWQSLDPNGEFDDLTLQLGQMARLYKCVLDRFEDATRHAQKDRDYRTQPIDETNLHIIVQDMNDALLRVGIDVEDQY
jgi:hypothetical protein